jgi:hypothetical protein
MGHFDTNGNWVADPSDDDTYGYLSQVTQRGQTFTWMGSGTGWIAEDQLSDSQLETMYWNYSDSGQDPFQGAYGNQIKAWSQSFAGFQSGYRRNAKQLTFATRTAIAAATVMGSGLTAGEAGGNFLINAANEDAEAINLASSARTAHIIEGDANGGGHAWFGSLKSFINGITGGKSMFPITWSKDKIMEAVSEVTVNNNWVQQTGKIGATLTKNGQPVKYIIEGVYEGVKIRVIATADDIVTAFPIK